MAIGQQVAGGIAKSLLNPALSWLWKHLQQLPGPGAGGGADQSSIIPGFGGYDGQGAIPTDVNSTTWNYGPTDPNQSSSLGFGSGGPAFDAGRNLDSPPGGGAIGMSNPQNVNGGPSYAPYDWGQLGTMLFGGGSGGSGGGSGAGSGAGQGSGPGGYLSGLYGGSMGLEGFDPVMMQNIGNLQSQVEGNYPAFQNMLNGLGSQYSGMIGGDDLLSQLLGGPGGGGSYSGGFSLSGGNNGGGLQLEDFQPNEIRTDLAQLDPETLAQLQKTTDSNLADFERIRSEQNDDLLLDLFGRGVNRSTVAGEALNRANESQERTRLAILSDAAQRELGLRTDLSDRILQGDLGLLGANTSAYGARTSAQASAHAANTAANASRSNALTSASASNNNARLGALASIFGSRAGALADIFGSQSAGLTSSFNTQQGSLNNFADLFGNIGLGTRQQDLDQMLGIGGLATQDLASKRQLQAARSGQNVQNMLDFLRFQESVNTRLQSADLAREQMSNAFNIAQLQGDNSMALAQLNSPSSWDKFINTAALLGSAYLSNR